jgi:hypothetical protein
MSKKIAIIGRGTAGSLSAAMFHRLPDTELEWHFDEQIKPQAVGEGSTLELPIALNNALDFQHSQLDHIDGSFKYGIKKVGWGNGTEFIHEFLPPRTSYHFNAIKLQNFIRNLIKDKVKIVEGNTAPDKIDADYIIDCSGRPDTYEEFTASEFIPVNSVHVTQCYWDHIRFQYTLTIARPYGWVFGIPLQNRCSIGYMYNNTINTLEEVKEDVKQIFKDYNLTPSEDTNTFSFKNYYRTQNYTDRVAYNGNASFFLEPLEATSIAMMDYINSGAYSMIYDGIPVDMANYFYQKKISEIQDVIMLHYFAGSVYDTEFWKYAQDRGERKLKLSLDEPTLATCFDPNFDPKTAYFGNYGTWSPASWPQNLKNLGLYDKFSRLKSE